MIIFASVTVGLVIGVMLGIGICAMLIVGKDGE